MLTQKITKEMVGLTIAEAFPGIKEAVVVKTDKTALDEVTRDTLVGYELEGCARALEEKAGLTRVVEKVE